MALRFEPDRVAYDPSEGLLRLFATDEALLVRCAVSKAALAALEDDALGSLDLLIATGAWLAAQLHKETASRVTRARTAMT